MPEADPDALLARLVQWHKTIISSSGSTLLIVHYQVEDVGLSTLPQGKIKRKSTGSQATSPLDFVQRQPYYSAPNDLSPLSFDKQAPDCWEKVEGLDFDLKMIIEYLLSFIYRCVQDISQPTPDLH